MDGWINGWMDKTIWMDGLMDQWMDGWIKRYGWMDGLNDMDGWING